VTFLYTPQRRIKTVVTHSSNRHRTGLYLLLLGFIVIFFAPLVLGNRTPFTDNTTVSPDYQALARADASAAGIPPALFVRQIAVESGFNPHAYSRAGAEGIAQFAPGTAAGLGIDPWDPVQALRGAANLMARYQRNYGGNYAKALAAYNGGSGRLQRAVQACGGRWLACEPPETRHYVRIILNA
jgi:soluble lytic murein transglycosylase-like protein